ncbi:MAG TPA: VOC family protein [Stellaceae bacterium]|nr:VOC family protein [Stellaceae bacterium]
MPDWRITATNHTAFTVSDLPRALTFFCDVLGFKATGTTRQQGDAVAKITGLPGAVLDIAFVDTPAHRIELIQYLAPQGQATLPLRPCDAGCAHVAFEVDDAEAAVAAIRAAGYLAVSDPQIVPAGPRKGGKNVYVRGPDGIIVEFQQAPARGMSAE